MSGVVPRYVHGPITYTVAETVTGGQLVEARAAGKVGVAAAGSLKVLGVAHTDARVQTGGETGSTSYGAPFVDTAYPGDKTSVGHGFYQVTYSGAANFGDRLIAAANGQVTPAGATPDARTVIGYCAEEDGVSAGATGLAKILG